MACVCLSQVNVGDFLTEIKAHISSNSIPNNTNSDIVTTIGGTKSTISSVYYEGMKNILEF